MSWSEDRQIFHWESLGMVTMYTSSAWQWAELSFLGVYALGFYAFLVLSSIRLSTEFAVVKGATGLRGLQPGWIFGRFVDMSDIQWRNFRGNLPALTMAMFIFTLLYRGVRCLPSQGQRWFWVIASLGYLSYLHGTSIIFVLTIALGNYALVKVLGSSRVLPIFLWIYNLAFLVANRIFDGYSFASFGDHWAFLDRYRGALPWHISFNLAWNHFQSRILPFIDETLQDYSKHVLSSCRKFFLGRALPADAFDGIVFAAF